MAGADEPGLQQRIVGGEREERQPDRDREQAEQPERIARGRRLAPAARDRQRQRQHRDHQQHQMDRHRNRAVAELHQKMRIGIAGEQQRLEEHHRHRPHRRRAAEPRQHHLGEQRLHREQQQRADEDRRGVDDQDQPVPARGRLVRDGGRIRRSHESSGLDPAGAGGGNSGSGRARAGRNGAYGNMAGNAKACDTRCALDGARPGLRPSGHARADLIKPS